MYNRYVRNDNGTYTRIPEESQVPPPSGHEVHAHNNLFHFSFIHEFLCPSKESKKSHSGVAKLKYSS